MLNRAIFLDRDGVINKWEHPGEGAAAEKFYILSWDEFEFCDRALPALKLLYEVLPEYLVMVVSNQSGIGKRLIDYGSVSSIFEDMRWAVDKAGGEIDDYFFCSHVPADGCSCRKPQPGLLYAAAYLHDIDLQQSWMIGDSISDMGAANNAEIPTDHRIYVRNAYNEPVKPYIAVHSVKDLYEAVEIVIRAVNCSDSEQEAHNS